MQMLKKLNMPSKNGCTYVQISILPMEILIFFFLKEASRHLLEKLLFRFRKLLEIPTYYLL